MTMKVNLKILMATLFIGLISLVACRTLDNGGDRDWAEVKITVNQPGLSGGSQSLSPSGTLTSLIMVIPASTAAVTAATDFTNAYDGQLQNLTTNTVTLTVPLNESIQLVKKTFSSVMVLADTYESTDFTAIGASTAFTIDGGVTAKTVTINLTTTGGWFFVDGDGATGINKNGAQPATAGQLVVYDTTSTGGPPAKLIAGWTEQSTSASGGQGYGQIRVANWDGDSTWSFIDGNHATDGLNYDTSKLAENVNLTVFDSKVYLAWTEYDASSKRHIHVKSWDGNTWVFKEGNGDLGIADGLNKDPAQDARGPSMAAFNSNLFIAWQEDYLTNQHQIRVKKWDGSSWTFVDGNGATGINKDTTKKADSAQLIVFDGNLYAVMLETGASGFYQIRVAELDGISSRTIVDGDGPNGLNKDVNREAHDFSTFVFNSKLYITWVEQNVDDTGQVRVLEWDKTSWTFVDGNGANGLNRDTTKGAAIPSLFEFNSKLHATWSEANAAGKHQLRVKQWDGSSTWTFIDGDGDNGLNKDSNNLALVPRAVNFNSKIYLLFMEGLFFASCDPGPCDSTKTDQIRVLQYN